MRLRQAMWRVLPALVAAIFLLAPGASATQRHGAVKHKAVKKHLRRTPAHRASRHTAKRKTSHKARTRRVRYRRHYYHRRHHYYRRRVRLPLGPSSSRIEQIQQALERSGYYQGDPTGKWDSSTIDAMKSFQQAHGITPTGKIDASSLQKLGLGSDVAGVAAPRPVVPADPQNSGKDSKSVGEGR